MLVQLSELKPDTDSFTPLYLQLANKLSAEIDSGVWQPDEALPSERTLSDTLAISRVTARKAIDILCKRGILTRKHGSGTYITPKQEQPALRLTKFTGDMRQQEFEPSSQWLSRKTAIATQEEILALGLEPNAVVSRLKRLRTADNVVIAIDTSTVPAQYLPDPKTINDTLYRYLESNNVLPSRALQYIRSVNATEEQAKLANVKQGTTMLHITRIGYLENGTAVELTHSYCRSDYYDFVT